MKIRDVLLCWDFILSLILVTSLNLILPSYISASFAKEVYSIAITILSILFPMFFAALAIIITTSEDDFVIFLEADNIYTGIVQTFKFSLLVIFISLMFSIVFYLSTLYFLSSPDILQTKWCVTVLGFLFFYSLFTVFNASLDAITYSKKRSEYLRIKNM